MRERGRLFILSGPAGAGKGTLRNRLFAEVDDMVYSVSCTTRPIRPGETDGRDYHFVTKDRFVELIDEGAFLEWAEVHGNYYGTRKSDVEACLESGRDVVLEIDVQGCEQIRAREPSAIGIFITIRSLDELENRLEDRGTETPDQILMRLRNAARELRYAATYEHVIVNDDLDKASGELIELVRGYRKDR
jgi:guanylate kinase